MPQSEACGQNQVKPTNRSIAVVITVNIKTNNRDVLV